MLIMVEFTDFFSAVLESCRREKNSVTGNIKRYVKQRNTPARDVVNDRKMFFIIENSECIFH